MNEDGGFAPPQTDDFAIGAAISAALAGLVVKGGAPPQGPGRQGPAGRLVHPVRAFRRRTVRGRARGALPDPGLVTRQLETSLQSALGELEAGLDMNSQEGIEAWLQRVKEKGLPEGLQLVSSPFPLKEK